MDSRNGGGPVTTIGKRQSDLKKSFKLAVGDALDTVEQLVEEQSLDPLTSDRTNVMDAVHNFSAAKKAEIHYLRGLLERDDHRGSAMEDDYSFYPDEADDEPCDGENEGKKRDFTNLELKLNHGNRPLWACADGRIFLETFSPLYKQAYDFLIAIAEPICRPESMHEYNLTPHSLYAAVPVGLETETIISVLNKLSKTKLPKEMIDFIHASTANYGKVKLVLKKNRYFIESPFPEGSDGFTISKTAGEIESGHSGFLMESELAAAAKEKETHAFEIDPAQVENVKQRCLPNALNYPMLEEYDFRNDSVNPDLDMELKPHAQPRPYQEKSLSKMFGNGCPW